MDKQDVIVELRKLGSELKHVPSKRASNSLNYYAKKNFGSWNTALKAAGFSTKTVQKAKLPKVSADLYYFLGLLYTDGHVVWREEKRDYQIQIYTSYSEELNLIKNLFKKLFDYKPFIRKRKMGFNVKPNYSIHMCSKSVIEYLMQECGLFLGKKAKRIYLPKFSSKKYFWHFLRGVIDGDGCVGDGVTIFSASKKFLLEIAKFLQLCGFETSSLYERHRKSVTYSLPIRGYTNLEKLYNILYKDAEFFYPRKKIALELLLKSFKIPNQSLAQSRPSSLIERARLS